MLSASIICLSKRNRWATGGIEAAATVVRNNLNHKGVLKNALDYIARLASSDIDGMQGSVAACLFFLMLGVPHCWRVCNCIVLQVSCKFPINWMWKFLLIKTKALVENSFCFHLRHHKRAHNNVTLVVSSCRGGVTCCSCRTAKQQCLVNMHQNAKWCSCATANNSNKLEALPHNWEQSTRVFAT